MNQGETHNHLAGLTLLGKSGVSDPTALLESFEAPANVKDVKMISDEVTALCPVTGQPDQYTVQIHYFLKWNNGKNARRCIESKSLKLKLQSYRYKGLFVEAFADEILNHVVASISPESCSVIIIQKPRGGISIEAHASYFGSPAKLSSNSNRESTVTD